jgi:formate dehydrogenase assembly factor FdhD
MSASGVKRTSRLIASSRDKLAAHWPATASPRTGTVLLTSRLFVEAVQKAAVMDVPALIAVSAPSGRPGRHLATQT